MSEKSLIAIEIAIQAFGNPLRPHHKASAPNVEPLRRHLSPHRQYIPDLPAASTPLSDLPHYLPILSSASKIFQRLSSAAFQLSMTIIRETQQKTLKEGEKAIILPVVRFALVAIASFHASPRLVWGKISAIARTSLRTIIHENAGSLGKKPQTDAAIAVDFDPHRWGVLGWRKYSVVPEQSP